MDVLLRTYLREAVVEEDADESRGDADVAAEGVGDVPAHDALHGGAGRVVEAPGEAVDDGLVHGHGGRRDGGANGYCRKDGGHCDSTAGPGHFARSIWLACFAPCSAVLMGSDGVCGFHES